MSAVKALCDHLQRASHRTSFWVLFAAYGIYFPIFFFADVPFGLTSIEPYAHGEPILDVEWFYTAEQAYQRLELFGEQGRTAYFSILMGDLIYPALLGGLMSVSITLLFRRLSFPGSCWPYLGLLPLLCMVFDYIEGALILSMLIGYPAQLLMVAGAAGFVTATKFLFGMLSFLALGVGLTAWLFQRLRAQQV